MSSYAVLSEFYDELTSNVSYIDRADYFDRLIKKYGSGGRALLDLGCGTGKLSEQMSKRGYKVIGLDISVDMLSIAQQKSDGEVLYINEDMRKINLHSKVDVIISALDTVNHLTSEKDVQKCFDSVYKNLNSGGIFIFDTNTIYKHKHIMGNNSFVYDMENVYCVWSSSFDEKTNVNEIDIDLFKLNNGAYYRSSESFCERAYEQERIKEMLSFSGFEVVAVFDSDSERAPKEKSERIIFLARK